MSSWDLQEIRFEMSARSRPHDIMGIQSRACYADLHAQYLSAIAAVLAGRRIEAWLDLGCSNMQLTGHLRAFADRVVGVEASTVALRIAKDRYPNIAAFQRRLPDLSGIAGPFQVASGFEVLYYLSPDELKQCLLALRPLLDPAWAILLVCGGGPGFDAVARSVGFTRVGQETWSSPRFSLDFLFWRVEQPVRQVEALLMAAAQEHGLDRCRELHWHDRLVASVSRHPWLWRLLVNAVCLLRLLARVLYGSPVLFKLCGLLGRRPQSIEVWQVTGTEAR